MNSWKMKIFLSATLTKKKFDTFAIVAEYFWRWFLCERRKGNTVHRLYLCGILLVSLRYVAGWTKQTEVWVIVFFCDAFNLPWEIEERTEWTENLISDARRRLRPARETQASYFSFGGQTRRPSEAVVPRGFASEYNEAYLLIPMRNIPSVPVKPWSQGPRDFATSWRVILDAEWDLTLGRGMPVTEADATSYCSPSALV